MNRKNQQEMLGLAIVVASKAHMSQKDKSGLPYILHPVHVMSTVKSKDPIIRQIAILHDVVEDTSYSLDTLSDMGFNQRTISALDLLTHKDNQSYGDYIEDIATNRDAILVKMADLKHNSDITRLKGVSDKDIARIRKYHSAYLFLKNTLKENF